MLMEPILNKPADIFIQVSSPRMADFSDVQTQLKLILNLFEET